MDKKIIKLIVLISILLLGIGTAMFSMMKNTNKYITSILLYQSFRKNTSLPEKKIRDFLKGVRNGEKDVWQTVSACGGGVSGRASKRTARDGRRYSAVSRALARGGGQRGVRHLLGGGFAPFPPNGAPLPRGRRAAHGGHPLFVPCRHGGRRLWGSCAPARPKAHALLPFRRSSLALGRNRLSCCRIYDG